MKLDLSCPVEVRGYTLSYTETEVHADVRLHNLSRRRVASFEAVAKWHSSASNRSTAAPFSAGHLRAAGESGFKISLSTERMPDANSLEILFSRVSYEDGADDWRCGEGLIVDVAPLPPISTDALDALRAYAGPDAVCYPRQDSQVWRCVCGRTNPNHVGVCWRCSRDHFDALRCTPEAAAQHSAESNEAEAESIPDEQIEVLKDGFLREHARRFRRTLAAAFAVLVLAAFFVMHFHGDSASPAIHETASLNISK